MIAAIDPAVTTVTSVIPGLPRKLATIKYRRTCAPLDTGLRQYDGITIYMLDQ